MEKLLNLLREYRKIDYVPEKMKNVLGVNEEKVISKHYGFIKRLVDNDKIDQTVIDGNFGYFCMEGFDTVDSLLMVLAISDTPIDDLISYLR